MASGLHQETKRNCCDGSVDRISSLPDKAISEILVCLPIEEAVATSKLSTTWRYKWMSIPELVFDEHSYAGGQPSGDQKVSFVNNVLLLHDGDITKFEVRGLSDYASPNVDPWLLLLSRKKLTNLMIHFKLPNPYVCHTCLFYCQALSTLKLKFCRLELPLLTPLVGFKNLTVLDLEEVGASKETIEFLVNTSPLLENLSITQWKSGGVISDLKISAPNLRKCVIHGNFGGIITFVKMPELRDTDINLGFVSLLDEIFGGLVKIQKAAFSRPFIEEWRGNFTYHHLNYLRLEIDFEDPEQVLATLWLSKISPSLKTIYIEIGWYPDVLYELDSVPELKELYKVLDRREDVLQSLETVDLEGFGGSKYELRFIQFFLLHANVLQTMNIGWKMDDTSHRKREGALVELVQFQRAASGVKIKLSGITV